MTNQKTFNPQPMSADKAGSTFNLEVIRADFPILQTKIYGKPLVYFDNGASSQRPIQVIDAISNYYKNDHSNIHRGVHHLSAVATEQYEQAREAVRKFINAKHDYECIFTSGTTESINLVAYSFSKQFIDKGDEIIVTEMEHHSNIVPWQIACEERGGILKVVPINNHGELETNELKNLIGPKTKLLAITHVSNTLGTVNPIKEIIEFAHQNNVVVLIDGAQAVPHMAVDVQDLNADFYAFSLHKMCGPTGVGILYGKEDLLKEMPPYRSGGSMIKNVSFSGTSYGDLPHKFEAGTPNIAGGIGTKAAIDYLLNLGMENINVYEQELLNYATQKIQKVDGLKIIGTANKKAGVLSFLIEGIHPYDTGAILDQLGIAVRTGHHCTEPIMKCYNIPGTVRASFAFYNTKEEIDVLIEGLFRVRKMLL